MKNNLEALNNYLFEAIERINDDELSDEELEREIKKSKQINQIAHTIIESGALALEAQKHFDDYGDQRRVNNPILGIGGGND